MSIVKANPHEGTRKTVCLNMIVRDEKEVIEGCLASVKPLIDYWVIIDTGSTDGTQAVIKQAMKDIPGELHERPWVNFAHNRNEALALAKDKADYTLFIDADERWAYSEGFELPAFDKDYYRIIVREIGVVDSLKKCFIDNRLDWKWEGVLHEVLVSSQARSYEDLKGAINLNNTVIGARTKDPQKYHKDAQVLERALQQEPNHSRYVFYLAQSYANAHEYVLALENYQKRAAMGARDPEVFWSMYCIGRMQELLGFAPEAIVASYSKAHQDFPTRTEPLYRIAELYFKSSNALLAYVVSHYALSIPATQENVFFVERWIYDWGLRLQFSDSAYLLGRHGEARESIQKLLSTPTLPPALRAQLESNLVAIG